MKKTLFLTAALVFGAGFAQAEAYKCSIETYGRPNNFAGSYQKQKELMRSWMPYKIFYIETKGDSATLYHSKDLDIPSLKNESNSNNITFLFRDYPYASGGSSRFRDTRVAISKADGKFSLKLKMNPGSRYLKSGGSAFGTCVEQ